MSGFLQKQHLAKVLVDGSVGGTCGRFSKLKRLKVVLIAADLSVM